MPLERHTRTRRTSSRCGAGNGSAKKKRDWWMRPFAGSEGPAAVADGERSEESSPFGLMARLLDELDDADAEVVAGERLRLEALGDVAGEVAYEGAAVSLGAFGLHVEADPADDVERGV